VVKCADQTLYTGTSNDVAKRIATHNAGKGAKYTRTRRPVRLLYVEAFADKSSALRFELQFKKKSRAQKEVYISTHQSAILPDQESD
jgi:putative endonuclease